MKEFLKKFMTAEEIANIETKYKEKHAGATGLPVYISKERLDEEIGKRKTAETKTSELTTELDKIKNANGGEIKAAVDAAKAEMKKEHDAEIAALKKDHELDEAIHKAHGRNTTAIKALINKDEDIEKELERLQKEESYLFEKAGTDDNDDQDGTGKHGEGKGGDTPTEKELEEMRGAVGINDYI